MKKVSRKGKMGATMYSFLFMKAKVAKWEGTESLVSLDSKASICQPTGSHKKTPDVRLKQRGPQENKKRCE